MVDAVGHAGGREPGVVAHELDQLEQRALALRQRLLRFQQVGLGCQVFPPEDGHHGALELAVVRVQVGQCERVGGSEPAGDLLADLPGAGHGVPQPGDELRTPRDRRRCGGPWWPASIRLAAIATARALAARWRDAVPFAEIEKGFQVEGQRLLLTSRAEGVFKPAQMTAGVLSIRSTLASRYQDEPLSDTETFYDYSPKPGRNRWLQDSMAAGDDVIYFLQVKSKPGPEYVVFVPVKIVKDDPERHRFVVDLAPTSKPLFDPAVLQPAKPARLYDSATVKVRLFQAHFRRLVLAAYQSRCCVCSLPERPLLDGAHITPDSEEAGEPVVNNGLALCALHHRAFDADMMSVDPEYNVVLLDDRLSHPTDPANRVLLDHRGQRIRLPRDEAMWPDRERLEKRQKELAT